MNKTKLKYVKYTKQELDRYVRDKNSCISLVNSDMHVGFPPWGFANFQETLTNIISRDKIGKYEPKMDGIVLDVRNIKVFGTEYLVHDDDPYNHINIKANFYIFRPRIGATIKGIVKHISHGHVAVIIYRVFNVSIRFNRAQTRDTLSINQQISFRIKKFDLHGAMPYIEGELIETIATQKVPSKQKHTKFADNDDEFGVNGADSGISTEETSEINSNRTKKSIAKAEQRSDSSSNSSDSSSESESDSGEDKANILLQNVKIKQEKFSDSEEEARYKRPTSSALKTRAENTSSSSDDEDDKDNEKDTKQSILLKNLKKEKRSSSESNSGSSGNSGISGSDSNDTSDSEDDDEPKVPVRKIKREKNPIDVAIPPKMGNPKSRPIKVEPASDVEGKSPFKEPPTNYRRSLNASQKSEATQQSPKRKRTASMSEHFDSLMEDTLRQCDSNDEKLKPKGVAKKKPPTLNESADDSMTSIQSLAMSSTLISNKKPNQAAKKTKITERLESPTKKMPIKIKQELSSEDESSKNEKNKKKTTNVKTKKSLKSMEADLFDSFLK